MAPAAKMATSAFLVLAAACGGDSGTSATATPTPAPSPSPTARYQVTFEAAWRADTHPLDFPANAHFSPLIGGSHSNRVGFWRQGDLASPGIEAMAETGRTSPLDAEIQAAVDAGLAHAVIRGGAIEVSPGTVTAEFEIRREFPLVTLVSMVAPSPDWFVGTSAVSLIENGDWVAEKQVELPPWDAGTDDGASYTSADVEAQPHQPIGLLSGPPVSSGGPAAPFGSFTFRRLQ